MIEAPYYGTFALGLQKEWSTLIDTLGVTISDINYKLLINKDYWENLSDNAKLGVIQHELGHILFFHLDKDLWGSYKDQYLLNIAMDLTVNSYIEDSLLEGTNAITIKLFRDYHFPKGLSTKEYYKLLKDSKDHSSDNSYFEESCKLRINSYYISPCTISYFSNMSGNEWDKFENILDTPIDHCFPEVSKDVQDLINSQLQFQMEEAEKSTVRGSIPAELQRILDSFKIKPPVYPWRSYLKRFVGNSIDVIHKKTRRKESLRYEDNPGLKYKRKINILVMIDTSGSIKQEELQAFFNEIYHIYKAGTNVDILECDASVKRIYEYKGETPKVTCGGGGTSMLPVIEVFNKSSKYTTGLYFTDGYGDQCKVKANKPLAWIVSSDGDADLTHYPKRDKIIFIK